MPQFVKVTWLPKSIGITSRPQDERIQSRNQKIREYFYGNQNNLDPFTIEVKFEDIENKLYTVQNVNQQFKLEKTIPDTLFSTNIFKTLKNRVIALSFAKNSEDLTQSNVAGFVCVTECNADSLTILSPQPEPLPDCLFLVTEIDFS